MIVVLEWRTSQIIPSTHHFILYYLSLSWRIWYDNFLCLLILVFISFWWFRLWCHLIWGTLYCIEHSLFYFVTYGIFRASIPLKKKHLTHLLRNIYLYLRTNRCSTIDPGPIVKCAVSRVHRVFCNDSLHDYNSSNWRRLA